MQIYYFEIEVLIVFKYNIWSLCAMCIKELTIKLDHVKSQYIVPVYFVTCEKKIHSALQFHTVRHSLTQMRFV